MTLLRILLLLILVFGLRTGAYAGTGMKAVTISFNAQGLAQSTKVEVMPATTNNPDEPPFMNGEPEHLRVVFDKDKLPAWGTYYNRVIYVYPVAQYRALFKGKEKETFNGIIADLKKIIATRSDKGIKELPVLPAAEATQLFHAQMKFLKFKQGTGVAFVTAYSQEVDVPIKHGDYFYTFQGLTDDGKFYVSAFYPIQSTSTAQQVDGAKDIVLQTLKIGNRDWFAPKLNVLDRMIESIAIK